MSKPYGYYLDPALESLNRNGPVGDWLVTTAIGAVLAGVVGWMFPAMLIMWLLGLDGDTGFGWVYLASVAVEVLPFSAWVGYTTWRDWRRKQGPWSPEATERRGVAVSRG